ncbi:MAG: cytochrome C oxidase subunit IV family protein [Bacteroidales bacterium]|nr:cytochrome C oxidase subunit IV family protein [Bacteroidales bacterium]MBK7173886.1 cytochrome C oxidase subunit IV family protein [Bacteroidales bacterium]
MSENNTHISSYGSHLMVLLILILLTILTVTITSVQLGAFNTTAAMIIASTKAAIVLLYFMHLKFDDKIFRFMVTLVLAIYAVVIVITFFDYLYR